MPRSRLHLLNLSDFADYDDVMTVDSRHNRRKGTRFQCLFEDGSSLDARTKSDVRQIGDLARGCHAGEDIARQVKTRLEAV